MKIKFRVKGKFQHFEMEFWEFCMSTFSLIWGKLLVTWNFSIKLSLKRPRDRTGQLYQKILFFFKLFKIKNDVGILLRFVFQKSHPFFIPVKCYFLVYWYWRVTFFENIKIIMSIGNFFLNKFFDKDNPFSISNSGVRNNFIEL